MPSSACDWSSDVCSSDRSEEHTSELQSRSDLVCRLLLEKKKTHVTGPRAYQRDGSASHATSAIPRTSPSLPPLRGRIPTTTAVDRCRLGSTPYQHNHTS